MVWNVSGIAVLYKRFVALGIVCTPYAPLSNGVRKDKYSDKMDRYFVDFKDQSSHKQSETEIETHTQRSQACIL